MEVENEWPIAIISTQDVASGSRLWSAAGRTRATVILKATFYLVKGGPMQLVPPSPILLGDHHYEGSFERSVYAASDLTPYLPRAEVTFAGHAYAPKPSPSLSTRLAVVGSRPLVDKTVHVYGERMWLDEKTMTSPVPFTRIPIRYERASRGASGFDENLVGMPKGPNLAVPNFADPHDPDAPAGFGPIPPHWPARRRLLRDLDPSLIDAREPAIPDTFAWSFFHAAPTDQRCSFFEGNEWVVLEGLHADHPRLESQVPSARARARVYGSETTGYREIGLAADTMWIDGNRSLCCIVWRGNFDVDRSVPLQTIQVFAGLEMPGRWIPWPGSTEQVPAAAPVETAQPELQPQPTQQLPQHMNQPMPQPAAEAPGAPSTMRWGDPGPAARGPNPGSARVGSTLMSTLQDVEQHARSAGMGAQPVQIAEAAGSEQTSSRDSVPAIPVDVSWLEAPDPAGSGGIPGSMVAPTPSTTLEAPPSELRRLIRNTIDEDAVPTAARQVAVTRAAPSFNDEQTFAGSQIDVARMAQEAEARELALEAAAAAQPRGSRPNPPDLFRPQKTTIRGLGSNPSDEPPPTARAEHGALDSLLAKGKMQGDEQATKQLQVPDVLLQMAAATSTRGVAPPPPEPAPTIVPYDGDEDELDPGPPTLGNMEAPPFSTIAMMPPEVHQGEMRAEVERRLRSAEGLAGLDLSDVDLTGFDLSGQALAGARLDRAILRGAQLGSADLSGASLEGADLSDANLEGSRLERTNFVSAKLVGANLRGGFVTDANFTGADARRACFEGASGQRAMFCRARFDGATFVSASLDGADFTEARLDGASLEGAQLPDLRAYDVGGEGAVFSRCALPNARFDGAVLERARFDRVVGDDSMWDRAVLDGASFEGARLRGASFTRASLRSAMLSGADLAEARFNRAVLIGAQAVGVDLATVTLDGADVTGLVT